MRKAQWAKSGNGPDWTDIEAALRAIDGIHLGKTGVLISAAGIGATGGLHLELCTAFEPALGAAGVPDVISESNWPCSEGCTLEGHILAGIYKHDFAIGLAYQQRDFKGA